MKAYQTSHPTKTNRTIDLKKNLTIEPRHPTGFHFRFRRGRAGADAREDGNGGGDAYAAGDGSALGLGA